MVGIIHFDFYLMPKIKIPYLHLSFLIRKKSIQLHNCQRFLVSRMKISGL